MSQSQVVTKLIFTKNEPNKLYYIDNEHDVEYDIDQQYVDVNKNRIN